MMILWHAWVWN